MVSLVSSSSIKSLRDYIGDKKEMIEIMFSCIEDNQLKRMIPDVLKDSRLEDIKAECLVELLGMSKKRITGILDGKELDESSDDSLELSDITDDEDAIKKERQTPEKINRKNDMKDNKSSKTSKKIKKDLYTGSDNEPPFKKRLMKRIEELPLKEIVTKKTKCQGGKKIVGDANRETKIAAEESTVDLDSGLEPLTEKKEGKNLLEILELEMRARAIRSLILREEKKNKETKDYLKPSSSGIDGKDTEDNDPEAVIIIDEGVTAEIDLTKDDSDVDEGAEKNKCSSMNAETDTGFDISHQSSILENSILHDELSLIKDNGPLNSSESGNAIEYIPRNWTERWLESNEVMKVVKTSKVLTNFKKRLLIKQKQSEEKIMDDGEKENTIIEGTVNEYSLLPSTISDCDNEMNEKAEEDPVNRDPICVSYIEPQTGSYSELLESVELKNTKSEKSHDETDVVENTKSEAIT